jgi:chorismate mutase
MKKLFALRGATCVRDDEADIVTQVARLFDELLAANRLSEEDIVSLIFSVGADISAKNPAAALRQSGRAARLALFTALEPPIQPSLPRAIRVLLHVYLEEDASPRHVYRNGAEVLRPDFAPPRDQQP